MKLVNRKMKLLQEAILSLSRSRNKRLVYGSLVNHVLLYRAVMHYGVILQSDDKYSSGISRSRICLPE